MIGSMPAVADVIISRLRGAGVAAVFGVPGGGSNLDLVEAAGRARLPFVLTSTETAGALAAVAQAEVTGRPGACLTTLGPGAASVVNGVAGAFLDRVPLIVFTDSHPEMFAHQRLDHRALMAPITKWSACLAADTADDTLERAIAIATAPPQGPVHLDCPGDVASIDAPTRVARQVHRKPQPDAAWPFQGPGLIGDPEGVALHLETARKPLLLVGLGARRPEDAAAIRAFCQRRTVPAMVTYKAKGVVPDDHPLFAGVFTNATIEQPVIDESDLLIGVGLDPVELIPRPWIREQPIVNCGPYPVEDRHVPFAAQLVDAVPNCVGYLDAHVRSSDWRIERLRAAVSEQRRRILVPARGLAAQDVVLVAAEHLAASTRVAVDAGAHMFPVTMLWPVWKPNDMLISNGLSTMGFALPAAIGAALLDRDRPVVALTGDGGLLMCAAELATAVRERLHVMVIVFSDASLSLIEIKQRQRHHEHAGVALGTIGWPALAASFGVAASCATSEAEIGRCIDQAVGRKGPSLIEARIDPSNYGRTLAAVRG